MDTVKQFVKRFVKRWLPAACGRLVRLFAKSDEGSGTVSGIALITVAAVMLGVVAAAGNLLICLHRAQYVADLAAVAAATALREGSATPCEAASRTTHGNDGELQSCAILGEDVQVTVGVGTKVPFASQVSKSSRAGPVACE
ncbi:Rv3654c family TadE-like protein [Bifidobacterium moukalabense]|jgi:secretion/DNA translocation related TadE-like protein|uniref:Rv3654c family TadE-like protein n=1 Tax=Bifidobacterium moukalabense TaxID=1333651 RepID=UPI0009DFE684|nr:Rv3654c family TadE-like protein [Bifidobacterium moukalabense]